MRLHAAFASALACAALLAQQQAQEPAALEKELSRLESDDPQTRQEAIAALVPLAKQHAAALAKRLEHRSTDVRLAALRVFQKAVVTPPEAALRALLADQSEDVRELTVLTFVACRPAGWSGELTRVAKGDKSQKVRRQAIVGLGGAKDLAVVPELLVLLQFETDDYIAKKIVSALITLTGENKRASVQAWEKWWTDVGVCRLRDQQLKAQAAAAAPGK